MTDILDKQRTSLNATIDWARKIRSILARTLQANAERVHFRPASTGVSMIGLLPERPQRGKSGVENLQKLADDFDVLFARHCVEIEHGRITGEKALQSFLIRDAQAHDGHLAALNDASRAAGDAVDLVFVTDELVLPLETGKIVCDVLALRVDGGRSTPVLLELKDARNLTELMGQVQSFAPLIDKHADLFAELYSVLLGRKVAFDSPTEKWIVWPTAGDATDPRERELRERDIRVVGYEAKDGRYRFRVGSSAA